MRSGTSGLHTFKLDHDYGWDDGLVCGGTLEVAMAPLPAASMLQAVLDDIAQRRPAALPLIVDTDDTDTRATARFDDVVLDPPDPAGQ